MNSVSQHIALQVLVCTIGDEGIARVASSHLPAVAGVEYVVCWQALEKLDNVLTCVGVIFC